MSITLMVVAGLAGTWLVYFGFWLRERRSPPLLPDSMKAFSRALGALARPGSVKPRGWPRPVGTLQATTRQRSVVPLSAQAARDRRRSVWTVVVVVAVASLLAVPAVGMAALIVHVLADLALLLLAWATVLRRNSPGVKHSNVSVLHPPSSLDADEETVPVRRAANG